MSLWWTVQLVSCEPEWINLGECRVEVHAPTAVIAAEEAVKTWLEEERPSCRDACLVVQVSREGQPTLTRQVSARNGWRTWSHGVPA